MSSLGFFCSGVKLVVWLLTFLLAITYVSNVWMSNASPFQTSTFQELFNDIKNVTRHLVLTPWNCSLKFRESPGTPSLKVGVALGVWGFTPSHFPTPRSPSDDILYFAHLNSLKFLLLWASITFSHQECHNYAKSMWCDSQAFFWPAPLQPLCLGREPKARVATIDMNKNFVQCFFSFHEM